MSDSTVLLYLHGVGNYDFDNKWEANLSETLASLGFPTLASLQVVTPKYANTLMGTDDDEPLPGVNVPPLSGDNGKQNRRDFERRIGALEYRLGRADRGVGLGSRNPVINLALALPIFQQAQNYLKDPKIRAQVLNRIIKALPVSGRVVVVAHSLGSVIAVDLLRRLPAELRVTGLVTLGSPLANGNFSVERLRESMEEPPTNLEWWVNFWNDLDPVASHRGVSSVFPWMIDFRIHTKFNVEVHNVSEYLRNETVGEAIGFALFGSRSKELQVIENAPEVPLDTAEILAVLALRFATLVKAGLKDDRKDDLKDRYSGALRQVQAAIIGDIKSRNEREGRPFPLAISNLEFDFSDPLELQPEAPPAAHIPKEEAVVLLMSIAGTNVIQPFEIVLPKESLRTAMMDLAAEMGLRSQFGAHVSDAMKEARDIVRGDRSVAAWVKWGAVAVGAAAIVVGTGGLALAGGAGLAGAAAITSALASFGPGGMIGGLLTAGTLVTAGGGGIAFGFASPGTTAESLEALVVFQLAAEILRKKEGIEPDWSVWRNLVETESQLRREYERLDEFSDKSGKSMKELRQKIEAVERVLKYMIENGLEPNIIVDTSTEVADRSPWFRAPLRRLP